MEGKYPFEKMLKYPHFVKEDVVIWERFIDKNPGFFDSVDYDVHVGKPREYPEIAQEKVKEGMEYLSRKRIDVVGYKNKNVFIVEIKPSASFSAIGQVLGETELFKKEFPKEKRIFPIILTDLEVPDIPELCKKYKILYFVV
jgi:hypothetical protein